MTDQRFDDLTKALGRSTSRRSVLKALAATALGGLLTRVDRHGADAAVKRPACSRINEPCSPAAPCCAGAGTCSAADGSTCCKPYNTTCINDSDCCGGGVNVCRKKTPTSLRYCLEPAALQQPCDTTSDCATGLGCDPATHTCLEETGGPCEEDSECLSGICDEYAGVCSDCHPDGDLCATDAECCSNFCDPNSGVCSTCSEAGVPCALDTECCSGICDGYSGLCIATCLPNSSPCVFSDPGACCSQCCISDGAGPGVPGCCNL